MNMIFHNLTILISTCVLSGLLGFSHSMYSQHPDELAQANAWLALSDSIFDVMPDSACYYASQAGKIFLAQQAYPEYVTSLGNISTLANNFDLPYDARLYIDSTAKAAQEFLSPDLVEYRMAISNYATTLHIHGNSLAARDLLSQLEQAYFTPLEEYDYYIEGNIFVNLGTIYLDLKENALAISSLKKGIRLLKQTEYDNSQMVVPHVSLALAYGQSHLPDSAFAHFHLAQDLLSAYPTSLFSGYYLYIYEAMCHYYYLLGDYEQALAYAQQAQSLIPNQTSAYQTRINILLGSILTAQGKPELAHAAILQAETQRIAKFGETGNPFLAAKIQRRLGDVYALEAEWPKAIHAYQKGLRLLQAHDEAVTPSSYFSYFPERATRIWGSLAQAQLASQTDSAFQDATASYEAAIHMLSSAMARLEAADSRNTLVGDLEWIYEGYLDLLWEAYSNDPSEELLLKALTLTEQSRTQLMRIALQESWSKVNANVPDSIRAQEVHLRFEIGSVRQSLQQEVGKVSPSLTTIDSLENLLFSLNQSLFSFIERLEQEYPRYAQLKYRNIEVEMHSGMMMKQTQPHQALWVAYWGKTSLHVFIYQQGQWKWTQTPVEQVDTLVYNLLAQLQSPTESPDQLQAFHHDSHALFGLLGLEHLHSAKQLVVIPDGPLHVIPFEVLIPEPPHASISDWSSLPYWGLTQQIRYQYTLVPIPEITKSSDFLASWYGLAPSYQGISSMIFNQEEVAQIGSLLSAEYLAGQTATKQHFFQTSPRYRWLHFAGHARADQQFPLQSHLEFADTLDANLYAWEVYNMQLPAEVLVLSGCETGSGKYQRGEGVMGLARAFRYAGVPNIIQSIWQADGQATQALMTYFYEDFQETGELTASLQQARKRFFEEMPPRFHHPYYWANFVLVGPDVAPTQKPWSIWLGMLGLAFLIMGGWWIWQKRSTF